MSEPSIPRCRICLRALEEVHGHLSCLNAECPLFGASQDSCCGGAPLPPAQAEEEAPIAVGWKPDP